MHALLLAYLLVIVFVNLIYGDIWIFTSRNRKVM